MQYHTGLPYATTDEFLAGAVPFISTGVAEKQAVIAITSPGKAQALREAAGSAADTVSFASPDEWYVSQARAFSRFIERARVLQDEAGRGLCILTDPSIANFDEEQVRRWLFVENVVSDVLPAIPISVMCAYDLRASGLTRAQIEISHPHIATGQQVHASTAFIEPHAFNCSVYAVAHSDAPPDAKALAFDGGSLAELRAFVQAAAYDLHLNAVKVADLVIAASEAGANAVEHGGGDGVARVWRTGPEVICEVVNAKGGIASNGTGFVTPHWAEERGRGIWMMRQLCEWVDLRAQIAGTTVRLHMRD